MHIILLAVVSFFAAASLAAPAHSSPHALHERRSELPEAWTKRSRAGKDVVLPVRIGLTQRNLDRGYDLLMEV